MVDENRIYLEEDEINLRELFFTIWNNKWKIVFFTFVITSATIWYVVHLPNIYKSEIILIPQEQKSSMGGLGALAGLAGVDMGGGEVSAYSNMDIVLKDWNFQMSVIKKYALLEKFKNRENIVYPLGLDFSEKSEDANISLEAQLLNTYKHILSILSISEDKKSGMIRLSIEIEDRFLAKELVDIFLKEVVEHLRKLDMKDIDLKIEFYEKELYETENLELQSKLTQLLSALIQKKMLANASQFYVVKKITDSRVVTIFEKVKPKRGLIVVVAFVTSIILGIFGVFMIEFIRGKKDEK